MSTPIPSAGYPDADQIIQRLQGDSELERKTLARELHDDIGGWMVSAVMDVSWVEGHWEAAAQARDRLKRVRQTLTTAIDFERRMIESLRPSLLDTVGLFSALQWLVRDVCRTTNIVCTLDLPAGEPGFTPEASIGAYRLVQEGIGLAIRTRGAKVVDVGISVGETGMRLRVSHDGTAQAPDRPDEDAAFSICKMAYRARGLGGTLCVEYDAGRATTEYLATIPAQAPDPAPADQPAM
jgi:signal transduction histidine kinase